MENASKALLMAGGILIAVLIIGLVVMVFTSSNQLFKTTEDIETGEQLIAFNKQYESYYRKLMRGTDIVSVINKAIDNNKRYGELGYNEPRYIITISFEMKEELVYTSEIIDEETGNKKTLDTFKFKINQPYKVKSNDDFKGIKENPEAFTDFKRRVFDCTGIKYHPETGRVIEMSFVEKLIDYNEGI